MPAMIGYGNKSKRKEQSLALKSGKIGKARDTEMRRVGKNLRSNETCLISKVGLMSTINPHTKGYNFIRIKPTSEESNFPHKNLRN